MLAPETLVDIRRELAAIISLNDRKADQDHAKKRLRDVQREIVNLSAGVPSMGLSDALRTPPGRR